MSNVNVNAKIDSSYVMQRLKELLQISRDPHYDRYLQQMMKDLASGKATPYQVLREADRTYALYQKKMAGDGAKGADADAKDAGAAAGAVNGAGAAVSGGSAVAGIAGVAGGAVNPAASVPEPRGAARKDTMEFKIGVGIFSLVGAVFILVAFVVFGFHFLQGIGQGVCLYVASAFVVLLSEILLRKVNRGFALVITSIGISCLYISTIVNYLVIKNVNGIEACVITLVIALLSILLGRKRNASSLRLISLLGCYLCFLAVREYDSPLTFLVMTGILLIINIASIFLAARHREGAARREFAVNAAHMLLQGMFTFVLSYIALSKGMEAVYVSVFVIASLVAVNLAYLRAPEENQLPLLVIFSIALGFMVLCFVNAGCYSHGVTDERLLLFYRLLTEVMAIVTALVFMILWGRDRRRWVQYYFMACVIVLFNCYSNYRLEETIGCLILFALTRLLYKVQEVRALNCILTVFAVSEAVYMCRTVYIIPFAAVLFLSIFFIRKDALFHEIVLTAGLVPIICFQFSSNWTLPGCMGGLFLLFLLFNHLPALKGTKQTAYNIVNAVFAGLLCACSVFCMEYQVNAVTMVIGAVMILVMFRERYGMMLPKKYLFLAGFLTYMILTAHFKTPVIVSILLMMTAIGCVGVGFRVKDKVYRFCGLVMALIVSLKLVVYDFKELESLPKIVLFLTVGGIALSISFLYVFLASKEEEEEALMADIFASIDRWEQEKEETAKGTAEKTSSEETK